MSHESTSYDRVPYPSVPFPQTHPDRLAAVARIFGMTPAPAPPAQSRVLEIGCALGDNVIPLALQHPEATILGIDLSVSQIEVARQRAGRMGLRNLRLEAIDVAHFPTGLGPFDYVLCHGVYSWVPDVVRGAILEVIRRHLAPGGVAYVSYNTNPGWRMRRAVRDILLHDTRNVAEPSARIDRSERLLASLAEAIPEAVPLRRVVAGASATNTSREIRRAHIFHDFLEEVNDAFYFHEFLDRISQHGLQFLAEADVSDMQTHDLGAEAKRLLAEFDSDPLEREQYLDFVKCRSFRQSLLGHATVEIDHRPRPERLQGLWLSARLDTGEEAPCLTSRSPTTFRDDRHREIVTDHPMSKAALLHLNEIWPRAIQLEELERTARERTSSTEVTVQDRRSFEADRRELWENLLQLVMGGLVEAHAAPTRVVSHVSERPMASPWTRDQAASGSVVTNLLHRPVELNELRRALLSLLDGTRSHEQILDDLVRAVRDRDLVIAHEGAPVSEPAALRAVVARALPDELEAAARTGFLVA